jgi:putative ABC transport system permease protein
MRVLTPTAKRLGLRVRGSYKDRLDFGGDYIVPSQTLMSQYGVKQDQFVLVRLFPNADEKTVQRDAKRALAGFPQVELLTHQAFKDAQGEQLNQVLGLIYVLLALSVIVSLFGIVNTLALAIHERTRELGMLRAIGTSRAQVRRMVRYESVITALIGAVIGAVLGVCFALIISRPLESEGFSLSFPVGTLLILLVLSGVAGVLAAIGPARRASRLDVLEALAYE